MPENHAGAPVDAGFRASANSRSYLSALWEFDIRAKALVLMAQAVMTVLCVALAFVVIGPVFLATNGATLAALWVAAIWPYFVH
ncbi:hypothetical protein [Pandoraea communis]|uniref:hypothetical protein n=1 Tax=Pandoraea communis TaxID=2508297 RepID=UPI00123F3A5B|nr:hypothetical protein [Pandoraea communis]